MKKLEEIKSFVDYLTGMEIFDIDANLSVQLDKNGETEGTCINVNFRYPGQAAEMMEDIDTEEVGVPNAEDSEIVASAMERMFKTAGGSGPCQSSYSIGPEGFSIFGCTRKCSEEPEHKCCKGGCKCKENKEKEELSPQEKEMLDAMMSSLPDILSEFEKVRRRYGK